MGEQKVVPIIGEAHTDTTEDFPRPMGATPRSKVLAHIAGPECSCKTTHRDECPVHGPNSDRALDAAIAGNSEMMAEVNVQNYELRQQLKGYERANEGLRTERADLLARLFSLEERLGRLVEDGLPAPTSLAAALEQLFDAEAAFAVAEHAARMARCVKYDAQVARDRGEAAAIVRLVGEGGKRGELPRPGAMSPSEAKDRLEEDSEYAHLAEYFRTTARLCDERETALRIAASRVETLRACVNALAKHSPLTARAVALSRHQQ